MKCKRPDKRKYATEAAAAKHRYADNEPYMCGDHWHLGRPLLAPLDPSIKRLSQRAPRHGSRRW